jgi:hypothetical protein
MSVHLVQKDLVKKIVGSPPIVKCFGEDYIVFDRLHDNVSDDAIRDDAASMGIFDISPYYDGPRDVICQLGVVGLVEDADEYNAITNPLD